MPRLSRFVSLYCLIWLMAMPGRIDAQPVSKAVRNQVVSVPSTNPRPVAPAIGSKADNLPPVRPTATFAEAFAPLISRAALEAPIAFLADSALAGRETGSKGGAEAVRYLVEAFKSLDLKPLGSGDPRKTNTAYTQPFVCPTGQAGKNVVGWIPATDPNCREYVLVTAHFDHLGTIKGTFYPGADSNASGVAALLNVAATFSQAKKAGAVLKRNLIFAAYDGKEYSMTGARIFSITLSIPTAQLVANINIDQIGAVLAPPYARKDYALVLASANAPERFLTTFKNCNSFYNTNLDIDYSFYDSPVFAEIYFEMTEQHFLADAGVPSFLITSGVNDNTYKPTDTPAIIDLDILERRTRWIFYSLWDVVNE